MKIKKEIWATVAVIGFLITYLIDKIAGPVMIKVGNPIAFLTSSTILNTYPLTATAIIIRTLAIFISVLLIASFIRNKYFVKAAVIFFVGVLAEFFAIQQLMTGFRVTTIQWTLSIAYGSIILSLGVIWFIFRGIWLSFGGKETRNDSSRPSTEEKSILEPPQE